MDGWRGIPKSLILNTPEAAAELCLRFAALSSLGGLDDRPWTAESTLDKGAGAASADMIDLIEVELLLNLIEDDGRRTRGKVLVFVSHGCRNKVVRYGQLGSHCPTNR